MAQDALRGLRMLDANNEISISKSTFSIYTPESFPISGNNWRVISLEENKFINKLNLFTAAKRLVPLQDIFSINQGALLGAKNVFNIPEYRYNTLDVFEKNFFRPLINNAAIKNGKISISEYVWFPYKESGMLIQSEDELENLEFAKSNLLPIKEKLQERKGIDDKWWGLTRPRNWQFNKEKHLYSTRFGNSSSFGFDLIGGSVIIEGNAFIPKKEMTQEDLFFYLAVFSSEIFDNLLSIYSRQLAGGKWYDLGNNFIKSIPVPSVHSDLIRISDSYDKLVEIGKELSHGNLFVKKLAKNQLEKFYPEIN